MSSNRITTSVLALEVEAEGDGEDGSDDHADDEGDPGGTVLDGSLGSEDEVAAMHEESDRRSSARQGRDELLTGQ